MTNDEKEELVFGVPWLLMVMASETYAFAPHRQMCWFCATNKQGNLRRMGGERPCDIYPNGVELPTNHAVLLQTFLYSLAEVEYCRFFPCSPIRILVKRPMGVGTGWGRTDDACCKSSQ